MIPEAMSLVDHGIGVTGSALSPMLLHCSFSPHFRTSQYQRALILFLAPAGVDDKISMVVLNLTCLVYSLCSSTWHGSGDKHA